MIVELKNVKYNIARINVLLGANGSGKSTELKKIIGTSVGNCFYIEGGRTIALPGRLDNMFIHDDIQTINQGYESSKKTGLNGRIHRRLAMLYKASKDEDLAYARKLKRPSEALGRPPPTKMDKLCGLFHDVFPGITLEVNEPQESLHAIKEGSTPYPIASLSDGEKQCLAILTDLMLLDERPSLVIVDEPEINLHPNLAVNLWNIVESELADTVFIYATHLIQFALRDNVEKLFALGGDNSIIEINRSEWIHADSIKELLYALPGIFASSKVLFCEGNDSHKVEKLFYEWLVDEKSIRVEPLTGYDSVVSASQKAGVFSKISSGIKIAGVVDSDFKPLPLKQYSNIFVLPIHEMESILCVPQYLSLCINETGATKVTPGQIEDDIKIWIRDNTVRLICLYVTSRAGFRIGISIDGTKIGRLRNAAEVVQCLIGSVNEEMDKARERMSDSVISAYVNEIDDRISTILKLTGNEFAHMCVEVVGKECLAYLCDKHRAKKIRLFDIFRRKISPDSVAVLSAFRTSIVQYFDK